jgi:hypothetical protein
MAGLIMKGYTKRRNPTHPRIRASNFGRKSPGSVNQVSSNAPPQPRKRASALAISILALVLGLVVLAIAAKTLHYSPQNTESRYYSSSVKIAKFGPTISRAPAQSAVPAPLVQVEPPQRAHFDFVPEIFPAAVPSKTGPEQLRSPPFVA